MHSVSETLHLARSQDLLLLSGELIWIVLHLGHEAEALELVASRHRHSMWIVHRWGTRLHLVLMYLRGMLLNRTVGRFDVTLMHTTHMRALSTVLFLTCIAKAIRVLMVDPKHFIWHV